MNRSVQMGTLALGASLLAALLLTPAGTSAQTKHHLNLGFNGGTWSGEDALNIEQGIGVDASFLFSAGPSLRIGPVAEYGNFAIGDTGDRVQEVDLGVEGRFVDMSRRWGVDPYIGLRLAYGTQTSDTDGRDLSSSGIAYQGTAGFYFPLGAVDHTGDLSIGIRALSLGDWEDAGRTLTDSGGTSFYWFLKIGIALGFGT